MKALQKLSFIALQQNHRSFSQQLDDGTANMHQVFAFPALMPDNDTYFYSQALNQPDRSDFIKAMQKEVTDLFNTNVWQLRKRSELGDIKAVKAIWSFKRKRAPDGMVIKHKARLCIHGGMQVKGVHFWDTYSNEYCVSGVNTIAITGLKVTKHRLFF